jgi:hypothetical protein
MKAMKRIRAYGLKKSHGLVLKPNRKWDIEPELKLVSSRISDSGFVKDPESCKSVSGNHIFLCGAPVIQCYTNELHLD